MDKRIMTKQLGIMSRVHIGCRDVGTPVLSFEVHISEGSGALQVLSWSEAFDVLKKVTDIRDLEGKPCWVETDGSYMKFLKVWDK